MRRKSSSSPRVPAFVVIAFGLLWIAGLAADVQWQRALEIDGTLVSSRMASKYDTEHIIKGGDGVDRLYRLKNVTISTDLPAGTRIAKRVGELRVLVNGEPQSYPTWVHGLAVLVGVSCVVGGAWLAWSRRRDQL